MELGNRRGRLLGNPAACQNCSRRSVMLRAVPVSTGPTVSRKDPDVVARVLEEFDPSGTQDRFALRRVLKELKTKKCHQGLKRVQCTT